MDHNQHKAAVKGDIGHFEGIAEGRLGSLVTHNKNTVLHVNIANQTHIHKREGERVSTEFVERILGRYPRLLQQTNAKGDAPLHLAARCGQADAVRALFEFARQQFNHDLEIDVESTVRDMLGMTNDEQNTALHEAVQSGSLDVVKILLEEADPALPYSANVSGETPLYLAAARGHKKITAEILQKWPSAPHGGPSGKTALHAAVCSGSQGVSVGCATKLLLDQMRRLTKEQDRHGWTPLHYAAYFGLFSVELLLKADISPALIPNDNDRRMTALHLAAGQGNVETVRLIIEYCPECCELVDDRGWNVLHFAMVSFYADDLKYLVDEYPVVRNLIFEKDVKGNTPFHVLAAVSPQLYSAGYSVVPYKIAKGYYQAVNKKNISAEHIYRYGFPDLKQEIQKLSKADGSGPYPEGVVKMNKNKEFWEYAFWKGLDEDVIGMEKASEYHLIVAALIATVTFAAAFTLPGGYKSDIDDGPNRGTAILTKNAAFQAFVVSDAIALVLSLSAVFIHFILSLKVSKKFIFLFLLALYFTLAAMVAMMVAFATGTYAMLATPPSWLAVVTCVIGLYFILVVNFTFDKVKSKLFGKIILMYTIKFIVYLHKNKIQKRLARLYQSIR